MKRVLPSLLILSFCGCDALDSVSKIVNPSSQPVNARPTPVGSATPSAAGAKAKANSELLREMYYVVYGEVPTNRAEFGNMLDSLNQGASLEGVYNGFTHSANYRKLEMEHPGALPEAVTAFSELLADFELELPAETAFTAESAKPLEVMNPAEDNPSGVGSIHFPKKKPSDSPGKETPDAAQRAALIQKYSKLFSKASIYTLKRILGEEALKLIQSKKDLQDLAAWYGKWVAKMADYRVDFGIPQRNLSDEQFHSNWAKSADPDSLRWEVLNRINRVLMARNGK